MSDKATFFYNLVPANRSRRRDLEIGFSSSAAVAGGTLSLTHKVAAKTMTGDAQAEAGTGPLVARSVTELVARVQEADVEAWRKTIPFAAAGDPFAGLDIALEDISPDTCLALICLRERLAGRMLPQSWIDFASTWEQGYTPRNAPPEQVLGGLLNALTHARLHQGAFIQNPDQAENFSDTAAWALAYVDSLVAAGIDPWSVPRSLPAGVSPEIARWHDRAHACFAQEVATYARVLAGALKVQLSVPLTGTMRRIDVDAIFTTEAEFSGALKHLLRTDPASPSGRGYALWGLYRTNMRGSGNDITISVDPAVGIDLKQLWIELEAAEERRWADYAKERGPGFERPRDPPRSDMISFKEQPEICRKSVQPWWEGRPLYTMIAAPRTVQIGEEAVPGSHLDWSDVKQILWRLYAPVQTIEVRRYEAPTEPAWRFLGAPPRSARRVLVDARTELYGVRLSLIQTEAPGRSKTVSPLPWSETLAASLAAFVDVGTIEMDRLPASGDFDVIEARGGVVLVTARGMLLLELGTASGFPMKELDRSAREAAATLDCARAITDHINDEARGLVIAAIESGSSADKRKALNAIYGAKIKARRAWAESAKFEEDTLVREFREKCELRWNGNQRLQTALDEIAELESMVVSSSEVRANATLNAIAFYGFPLSIFGNLLGAFLIVNNEAASVAGFNLHVLGVYFGLSISAMFLVWLAARLYGRHWKPDQKL